MSPIDLILPTAPEPVVLTLRAAPAARGLVLPVSDVVRPPTGADFDPEDFSSDDFKTTL